VDHNYPFGKPQFRAEDFMKPVDFGSPSIKDPSPQHRSAMYKAKMDQAYAAANASPETRKIVEAAVAGMMLGVLVGSMDNVAGQQLVLDTITETAKKIDALVKSKSVPTSNPAAIYTEADISNARTEARKQLLRDILCDIDNQADTHDLDPDTLWQERFQ